MKHFLVVLFAWFPIFILAQTQQTRPNILVIMLDDAGLDMSVYGSSYVKTPAFDKIAREGILFTKAYTPNAKCAPSRASILTGRNSWQLDAVANHYIYFPSKFKTFPEVLKENGYVTGHTGKGWSPGIALTATGEVRDLVGKSFDAKKTKSPTTEISVNDYSANFKDFLNQVPKGNPWNFWIGINEPHRGYEYQSGVKKGGKRLDMIKEVPKYFPDSTSVRHDLLDYAMELEYADSHVTRVLNELKATNQLENTLIIYTSDHGMPFPRVKGNQYENSNHIPMAIMWKGKILKPNRSADDYISFVDIAPTLLEVAGIDWKRSGMYPSPGKSLLNIFETNKSGTIDSDRNFVLVGQERHDPGRPNDQGYPVRGIHKDNMLLLHNYESDRWPACNPETGYLNVDKSPTKSLLINLRRSGVDKKFWQLSFGKRLDLEFYDIKKDPYCLNNLAYNSDYKKQLDELENFMNQKLMAQDDLRMQGYGYLYEQFPFTQYRNYYENYMNSKIGTLNWADPNDYEPTYIDNNGENLETVIRKKNTLQND
ncbi:sulfatase family protein [Flavobacterium nackdongense]|uniref:Heparan N-sulfatase n=1 Tax=Flavobacterium nackdongense TaxID=2547394 RepID=A0A4P6YIX7_9FLAO|nr:sulfatase [Flavobacterium nackdongense]QBN20473.1 heparan N-sulfatase [Flavobacterium nackdongense]